MCLGLLIYISSWGSLRFWICNLMSFIILLNHDHFKFFFLLLFFKFLFFSFSAPSGIPIICILNCLTLSTLSHSF